MDPEVIRYIGAALGVVAFSALSFRLVSTWPRLTVLEHAAIMLLLSFLFFGAWNSALLATNLHAPITLPLIALYATRAGCIVLAIFWNKWMGRRHSPFRRTSPAHRGV